MTAVRRWGCVGLVVLLLVAAPVIVRALPASESAVAASALLERVRSSRDEPFTGYAETAGNVALPANDALSGLAKLLSDSNRVRVWWRDPDTWRVSTLRTTGETDLVHRGDRTLRWVYESKNVTVYPDVSVRLPTTVDLLPPELARRSLAGARASELERLPARRVAGRDALGLRLRPADEQSSIGRVDVYVDRETAVPLSVELFARGARIPAVSSVFRDVAFEQPDASALSFEPPDDAKVRFDRVVDLASAADRFASRVPPKRLAGLPARDLPVDATPGSVGVYGRGPTVLLAIPLWSRSAERVRADLEGRPGVLTTDRGVLLAARPLRLLLAEPEPNGAAWLLAGTVTEQALEDAADQLAAERPGLRLP